MVLLPLNLRAAEARVSPTVESALYHADRERRQREQSQEGPEDRRHELAAPTLDGDSILSWERATGDWLGARSWLAERGVEAELLWTSDLSWVARGGVAPGATPFRSLFDLVLTAHTEELIGFEGGTLLVDFQAFLGDFGSSSVGDAQGFSNIDADDRAQLSKLWWEQRSQSGALTVRLGKMDANALFYGTFDLADQARQLSGERISG